MEKVREERSRGKSEREGRKERETEKRGWTKEKAVGKRKTRLGRRSEVPQGTRVSGRQSRGFAALQNPLRRTGLSRRRPSPLHGLFFCCQVTQVLPYTRSNGPWRPATRAWCPSLPSSAPPRWPARWQASGSPVSAVQGQGALAQLGTPTQTARPTLASTLRLAKNPRGPAYRPLQFRPR